MLPEQPARELLDAVALADRLGYHACYSADEIYHSCCGRKAEAHAYTATSITRRERRTTLTGHKACGGG